MLSSAIRHFHWHILDVFAYIVQFQHSEMHQIRSRNSDSIPADTTRHAVCSISDDTESGVGLSLLFQTQIPTGLRLGEPLDIAFLWLEC